MAASKSKKMKDKNLNFAFSPKAFLTIDIAETAIRDPIRHVIMINVIWSQLKIQFLISIIKSDNNATFIFPPTRKNYNI